MTTTSKTAGEIFETVVEDGQKELERANVGLAFSGFAAGLNISFSVVALAVVGSLTGGVGFLAYAFYPLGFLLVILGRAQLYTENTVTPVVVVLSRKEQLPNMLRLWVVIFVFNVLGATVFAAALIYGEVLSPEAVALVLGEVSTKMDYGFATSTIKGIFGGWLVAMIAWMVAASRDTISQVFFIYLLVLIIPAAGLTHCIAGSTEVLMGVFVGEYTYAEYLGGFLLPATIGNTLGGVFLVTLLNYGQVIGSRKRNLDENNAE